MDEHTEKHVGLTTVYLADGMLHAMVVRGALESAGIPVMLSYESVGPVYGVTIGTMGQVRVMVPVEWENEAQTLLNIEPRTGEIFSVPAGIKKQDA